MDRPPHLAAVETALRRAPVVAILGPRQVGKTTLALALARRRGRPPAPPGPQRRPGRFPVLRVLADRRPVPARFLVLGSASPELLRQSSESLAGRIHYHELTPFGLDETGAARVQRLWLRGGFPRSYLARRDAQSAAWRRDFIRTYLERDVPQL